MNFDPFVKENASFQFAKLSYELGYHDVSVKVLQDFISDYPKSSLAPEAKAVSHAGVFGHTELQRGT
jgi:TolA-binding protein